MKMNKNKILVSTLALAMGAGLAGSVSGTMAWFQYSTRVQAAYIGSSAHCSEALEVSADDGANWSTELRNTTMQANKVGGTKLEPISTGNYAGTTALPTLYKNPIYQITDSANWGEATSANYVQFNLKFHVKDVDGVGSTYLAKNLYLTDLTIKSAAGADLTKAIRVHFNVNNSSYKLFANDGTTAGTVVTNTYGALDLNNNGVLDKSAGYEDLGDTRTQLVYGASSTQTALNASGTDVLADDSDPNNIVANQGLLGAIPNTEAGLSVTVTMWIEGWQKLATGEDDNAETSDTALWKAETYANKDFKVGMRFATDAHVAH